ncbi:MAG: hypothetical protein SOY60_09385 [Fusobacterium gastrosuis]|nr:hypothetical protein [Fusobacterium gastrosuis]
MKLSELKKLIEKYGNVRFVDISKELKALGYACNVPAGVDA